MKAISRCVLWIALGAVAPAGLLAQEGQRRLPEPPEKAAHGRITVTEAAVVAAEKWMAEHREGLEKRQIKEQFRQITEQRLRQVEEHIAVRLTETMRALRKSLQTSVGNSNEREVKELRDLQTQLETELKARRTKRLANNRLVDPQRDQIQEFRILQHRPDQNRLRKERQLHKTENDENKQRRERIEHELNELRPKLEELTAAGKNEKAEQVKRAIQELRHEWTHTNRIDGRGQDAIIRELDHHREQLERKFDESARRLAVLAEQGKEEAVEQAKRGMQELRQELARVHHKLWEHEGHEAQERREHEERREYERRREHEERQEHEQRREGGHEEMERRIQHMQEAMENLHAAGRHELAEEIGHEAERMEREFHERGRHEEDSHGREAVEALHHLGGQIEHVNNQLDRTNDQLAEVANMLRMLVGKLGIHSDHRNNDRGHRNHEGHRPDDDRGRSSNHRERHDDDGRDHDRGHEHHSDGQPDDHDGDERNRGDDHDDR